jgi:hypothetical protein
VILLFSAHDLRSFDGSPERPRKMLTPRNLCAAAMSLADSAESASPPKAPEWYRRAPDSHAFAHFFKLLPDVLAIARKFSALGIDLARQPLHLLPLLGPARRRPLATMQACLLHARVSH